MLSCASLADDLRNSDTGQQNRPLKHSWDMMGLFPSSYLSWNVGDNPVFLPVSPSTGQPECSHSTLAALQSKGKGNGTELQSFSDLVLDTNISIGSESLSLAHIQGKCIQLCV